jgi:hypothetical protein
MPEPSGPSFHTALIGSAAVSTLAIQLAAVLTHVHTKRSSSFAFAVLRTALTAVTSSLLRRFHRRRVRCARSISRKREWPLVDRIVVGVGRAGRMLRRTGGLIGGWLLEVCVISVGEIRVRSGLRKAKGLRSSWGRDSDSRCDWRRVAGTCSW